MTKQVTVRALLARLNRKLAHGGERVYRCRQDSRWHRDVGDLYAVDVCRNIISRTHLDLEQVAREEGVLREYESLGE